jgi:hypothetical protein
MHRDPLRPDFLMQSRGMVNTGVSLLHANAHPHTDVQTVDTLLKLNFDVLEHYLARSDYHVFGPLRDTLRGRHYTSDQKLTEGCMHGLSANQKHFFCSRTETCGQVG